MGSEIRVRRCKREDLRSVCRIERDSFEYPYSMQMFEHLLRSSPDGFLVAQEGQSVIGYAVGVAQLGTGTIVSTAVSPAHRGKGVGERLLADLIQNLSSKHVKRIELQVKVSNQNAIKLYEKMGFQRNGTISSYYPDGSDALVMYKML